MANSHDATGSMLGYLFQCRYALLAALDEAKTNPGNELSIERFDDIAFEDKGEPQELIQTKHSVTAGALNDLSVDVWKTLHIWMQRAKNDPQQISRKRFVLLTTATAEENSGLSTLRQDSEHRNVGLATEKLLLAATQSKNKSTHKSRQLYLSMDKTTRDLMMNRIWVFDNAPNILNVRHEIETELTLHAPTGKVETFTDHLEGWWFSRIIRGLTNSDSPSIPLNSLHGKIREISNGFSVDGLPLHPGIESFVGPSFDENDQRPFVRQMRFIDLDERNAAAGAKDYYKAFTQRSRWVREELLLDEESRKYDTDLSDAFEREMLATVSEDDLSCEDAKKSCGKKLFHWARRHPIPLRNRDELWLSAGSFQMLADRAELGWHPDYKKLLGEDEE